MSDLISRQTVLDAIQRLNIPEDMCVFEIMSHIEVVIATLPPATPQPKYEDIAKAFQMGIAFGFGKKYDEMDKVIEEVKKAVTPQPKIGHWIMIEEEL